MTGGYVTVRVTSRWPWNPASLCIGLLAGSHEFSHAFAIIGDRAYEASMTHGCRSGTVDELMAGIKVYQDMRVWVPDLEAARAFAQAQIGKRYDWAGAIGLPFTYSTSWADTSKWWCSELVFAILSAGGTNLFDPAYMDRVRPVDLLLGNYKKTPVMTPA